MNASNGPNFVDDLNRDARRFYLNAIPSLPTEHLLAWLITESEPDIERRLSKELASRLDEC